MNSNPRKVGYEGKRQKAWWEVVYHPRQ